MQSQRDPEMMLTEELAQDIERRVAGCVFRARANYFFAYLLLTVAVVASAGSAISVAAGGFTPEFNAIFAALSGIIVLALSTFRFEGRAEWWFTMHHGLDALYRGLKYEGRKAPDISRELTTLIVELERKWPGFGKPPSGAGT
jgi:hypothetical protein